jgi:small subunit ribosomal protein S6
MIYYEMLLLLTSDISQDTYDAIKNSIQSAVVNKNGTIKNYDRWGKYLLAYPIKKYTYGIYVLVRFGVAKDHLNDVLNEIRSLCALRFNLSVMRYVFVRLGKNISPVYCRPDSLEDSPRRENQYDIEEVISRKIKPSRGHQEDRSHRGESFAYGNEGFAVLSQGEDVSVEGSI